VPSARALVRKARSGPAGAGYVPEDELQLTGEGSASLAHVPLPLYQQNLMRPYWLQVLAA